MPEINVQQLNTEAETIQEYFGQLCNVSLPFNHSASWEILVSKQHICNTDSKLHIPVLFRVHHSLGDGIALLRLFLETVADKDAPKRDYWAICSKSRPSIFKLLNTDIIYARERSWFSTFKYYYFNLSILYLKIKQLCLTGATKAMILIAAPASFINQSAYQKIDENCLHESKLSGEKVSENSH